MTSYVQMLAQIEDLKKQAEKARKEEISSVIKTIKRQIADYGITAQDLGLSTKSSGRDNSRAEASVGRSDRKSRKRRANAAVKVAPKYRDEAGNSWTGRGKQPRWVVAAIAAGRSLDSMLIR